MKKIIVLFVALTLFLDNFASDRHPKNNNDDDWLSSFFNDWRSKIEKEKALQDLNQRAGLDVCYIGCGHNIYFLTPCSVRALDEWRKKENSK